MSETHDPWKDVEAELARCREIAAEWGVSPDSVQLSLTPDSLVRLLAARAAEATQHQQEIAAKDAIIKQQAADLKVGGEMQDRETALKALHDEIDWMLGGVGTPDSLSLSASILMRWRGVLASPLSAPPQEPTQSGNVRALTVHICEDCLNLRGEMCNEPCCRFCRRTMAEVAEYLDVLLIRPRIDGVSVLVDEGTPLPPVSPQEPTGASPQSDMTQCDYCCTWRSRPCGEGCCWQPASLAPVEPTPEPETCEWREWNADGYGKPACRPTNSGTNWHRSLAAQMKKCPECGKPLRLVPSEEPK